MSDKINFEYIKFSTEVGDFLLLNTEFDNDVIEVIQNTIYIKRIHKLFETAIIPEKLSSISYLGKLEKIDHTKIFDLVLRYNLVEYKKDPMYLWRSLDAIFNLENITILENQKNLYKFYNNPHLFKITKK